MWRIAWRNAIVERRRTALMALSLALASFLLVLGASLLHSADARIEAGLAGQLAGDVQVFDGRAPRLDLTEEIPLDFPLIERPAELASELRRLPEVAAAAPRLTWSGLLLAGDRSSPAVLLGIDPEIDPLAAGGRSEPGGQRLAAGQMLAGAGLAGRLALEPGGELAVLAATPDGLFDGQTMILAGRGGPEGVPLVGELFAYLAIEELAGVIGVEGRAGSIAVWLRPGTDAEEFAAGLPGRLAGPPGRYAARTWRDLGGALMGIGRMNSIGLGVGYGLLAIVTLFAVASAALIMVFERTAEFGTMRALGAGRGAVLGAVLAEMALIAGAAAAAGSLAAYGVAAVLGRVGVPAVSLAMAYALGADRFYLAARPADLAWSALAVVAVGLAAAFFPALRAARTPPAAAMRSAG